MLQIMFSKDSRKKLEYVFLRKSHEPRNYRNDMRCSEEWGKFIRISHKLTASVPDDITNDDKDNYLQNIDLLYCHSLDFKRAIL